MKRPIPMASRLAAKRIGENLSTWRRLYGISSQDVSERAAVSRATISRLENGDPSVSFATVLNVCRAVGILDALVEATDPYETDLGRARADHAIPQRVRSKK